MNYEIFIWAEAAINGLNALFIALLTLGILGCMITGFGLSILHEDKELVKNGKKLLKRFVWLSLITGLVLILSSPLANFSETYKKILIYRGINSTLVDKSVDTAEKALELLNAKIDSEMNSLKKLEKE
jgi:energy-coupling factor transporter transmembrane protein EcfT